MQNNGKCRIYDFFFSLYSPTFLLAPRGISSGLLVCLFLGIFFPSVESFFLSFHLTIRVLFIADSYHDLTAIEVFS